MDKRKYETHITVNVADAKQAKAIAEPLGWKTSTIDGDEMLGPGKNFYITRTVVARYEEVTMAMLKLCMLLTTFDIKWNRRKIEDIVYDERN